jgi:hypothetical protein
MKLNSKTQLLCAWCSPIATLTWLVGFGGLAGFIPPPSPNDSALQVQAMYQDNPTGIRIGLFLTCMGAALIGPFVASVSSQMRRIEGDRHHPLSNTQLGLGMLMVLLFIIPCFLLLAAAYRPDRDPAITQALNDAGWLPFVGGFMATFFQLIAIGICIFQDTEQKVYPRWLGYFNFWAALILVPAGIDVFFKTGPFAWNGFMAFWLVLVVFCVWFLVMFNETRKAINREAAEEAALGQGVPASDAARREPVAV